MAEGPPRQGERRVAVFDLGDPRDANAPRAVCAAVLESELFEARLGIARVSVGGEGSWDSVSLREGRRMLATRIQFRATERLEGAGWARLTELIQGLSGAREALLLPAECFADFELAAPDRLESPGRGHDPRVSAQLFEAARSALEAQELARATQPGESSPERVKPSGPKGL